MTGAIVGRVFGRDRQEVPFLRFAVEKVLLRRRDRYAKDRDGGMPALVGVARYIADLGIEQIGLGRAVGAVRRRARDRAAGQQLLPVDDLKDAVLVDAIGQV